jgi:hypothetical protein
VRPFHQNGEMNRRSTPPTQSGNGHFCAGPMPLDARQSRRAQKPRTTPLEAIAQHTLRAGCTPTDRDRWTSCRTNGQERSCAANVREETVIELGCTAPNERTHFTSTHASDDQRENRANPIQDIRLRCLRRRTDRRERTAQVPKSQRLPRPCAATKALGYARLRTWKRAHGWD